MVEEGDGVCFSWEVLLRSRIPYIYLVCGNRYCERQYRLFLIHVPNIWVRPFISILLYLKGCRFDYVRLTVFISGLRECVFNLP